MTFVLFLLKKLVYYYQAKVLPDACFFFVNEAIYSTTSLGISILAKEMFEVLLVLQNLHPTNVFKHQMLSSLYICHLTNQTQE